MNDETKTPLTTIERDLAAMHQLLCTALANWIPPEPGEPGWPREAAEKQEIYPAMKAIFDRYPGVLYHDHPRTQNPIAVDWESWTDEQRLLFLEQLPCCRHCGSLDPRCQCWNDE